MKHLFGPVPSRRLGVSLGVDLVPLKVCSLNCVYCEVGRTTTLTTTRDEYVNIDDVIKELDEYLSKKPDLDFITFSGQGEPTLNSRIGDVITFIKSEYPQYKLALITNGTLFYMEDLRKEIIDVDLILPSLDAATVLSFNKVDRPAPDLELSKIIDGLVQLRKEFKKEILLEVFIVPGINDSMEDIDKLKEVILKIAPDSVQLNSLDRPGTESWVEVEGIEKLKEIKERLAPLPVEIIAKFKSRKKIDSYDSNIAEKILSAVARRPLTDEDLMKMLDLHINELNKYLGDMILDKTLSVDSGKRGTFYKPYKD